MRKKNIFTRKELIEVFREIHNLHSVVSSAEFFQGWDKAVGACEEEFTQKTGIGANDLDEEADPGNDPVNHPSHYCDGIETIDFIESKEESNRPKKILIHCIEGISRAPALIAGYLMWKQNLRTENAIEFVKSHRKCVDINLGFIFLELELLLSL